MKKYVILLATEDLALEAAVKEVGGSSDCELNCVRTSREAVSMVLDGDWKQDVAVVDIDLRGSGRSLVHTAGGALPVIAITGKAENWLTSMVRHHQVHAALVKPVSLEKLRAAFQGVRSNSSGEVRRGR